MILHRYPIRTNSRTIRIRPFGDLQFGDPGFRKDLWDRWIKEAIADKNSWFIGMGDYSNTFRPTINKAIKKVLVDDLEAHNEIEYMVMKEMQEISEKLKQIRDKIIGIHSGHHNFSFMNGTNSDQYLCQLLKCRWLGFEAITKLDYIRCNEYQLHVDIFSTHGCGGSSFSSTDMYNLERRIMPFWDADIFLRGHSTKVYAAPGAPLTGFRKQNNKNGELKLVQKKRWLINTGGFMEGRIENHTSYIEEKNMPSCALGWVIIEIHHKEMGKANINMEISPKIVTP